jgi:hypothetical protein
MRNDDLERLYADSLTSPLDEQSILLIRDLLHRHNHVGAD